MRAAVVAGTGKVGRVFGIALAFHPELEPVMIIGDRSRGRRYEDVFEERERIYSENYRGFGTPMPAPPMRMDVAGFDSIDEMVAGLRDAGADVVFSALPNDSKSWEIEEGLAYAGLPVFSNCGQHRMDLKIPLVVPDVNPSDLHRINQQPYQGFIVKNANCSTIPLTTVLRAISEGYLKKFGEVLSSVAHVTTYQAVSGRGDDLYEFERINGNVIADIPDEARKMKIESEKILGNSRMPVVANCNRVPTDIGHFECLHIDIGRAVDSETAIGWLLDYASPAPVTRSSPDRVFSYSPDSTLIDDCMRGGGHSITLRSVQMDSANWCDYRIGNILKVQFVGNNLVLGAAGSSIRNYEIAKSFNYL